MREDWIQLARDRDKPLGFANTVLNHEVNKCGKYEADE
jgi:hypothetical protein